MSTAHRMMRDGFAMLPVAELITRVEAERIAERTAWPTAVDLARACLSRRQAERSYVRCDPSVRPRGLTGAPKKRSVIDFEILGSHEVAAAVADHQADAPYGRHHVRA